MRKIVMVMVLAVMMLDASRLSDLMARYKRAPESQRYKIMNQIKREIARLNRKRQHAAIRKLRALNQSTQKRTNRKKQPRHRTRTAHGSRHPSPMDILQGHSGTGASGTSSRSSLPGSPGRAAHSAASSAANTAGSMVQSAADTAGNMAESVGEMVESMTGGMMGGGK
jgi:DNA polymerase III gamma/tau subunit